MGWMNDILVGMHDMTEATMGDVRAVDERTKIVARNQRADSRRLGEKEWEIAVLKDELGRHKLAIEALTRFLIEEKVIDEAKLLDFVKEVDAEDGVVDGKLAIEIPKRGPRRLMFEKKPPRKMIVPGAKSEESSAENQ